MASRSPISIRKSCRLTIPPSRSPRRPAPEASGGVAQIVRKQCLDPSLGEILPWGQDGERARASEDVEERQDFSVGSQPRPEIVEGNEGIRPRLPERHQGAGDPKSSIDEDEIN